MLNANYAIATAKILFISSGSTFSKNVLCTLPRNTLSYFKMRVHNSNLCALKRIKYYKGADSKDKSQRFLAGCKENREEKLVVWGQGWVRQYHLTEITAMQVAGNNPDEVSIVFRVSAEASSILALEILRLTLLLRHLLSEQHLGCSVMAYL